MPKIEIEPVTRIHVYLYDRDIERIDKYFGKTPTNSAPGRSAAIRTILRKFLDGLEAKAEARTNPKPVIDNATDIAKLLDLPPD